MLRSDQMSNDHKIHAFTKNRTPFFGDSYFRETLAPAFRLKHAGTGMPLNYPLGLILRTTVLPTFRTF